MTLIIICGFSLPAKAQDEREIFTSADGNTTLEYPADWFIGNHEFGIVISNNENLPESDSGPVLDMGDTLADDDILLFILSPLFSDALLAADHLSPEEAVLIVIENFQEDTPDTDVTSLTLGENPAASALVKFDEREIDGAVIVLEVGGIQLVSLVMVGSGGYAQHEEAVLAIHASLHYSLPEGPQLFTSQRGTFRFMYPEDWDVLELDGLINISNRIEEVFSSDSELSEGTIYVSVITPDGPSPYLELEEGETITPENMEFLFALPFRMIDGSTTGGLSPLGDGEPIIIGEHEGVRIDFESEDIDNQRGFRLLLNSETTPIIVHVIGQGLTIEELEEQVLPIIESMESMP